MSDYTKFNSPFKKKFRKYQVSWFKKWKMEKIQI